MLMKTTIIFLTILYLILIIVAHLIYNYTVRMGHVLSSKEIIRLCLTENICKVISYAVLIIDAAFILAFLL